MSDNPGVCDHPHDNTVAPFSAPVIGASPRWRRSRRSGSTGGQCVEVAAPGDGRVHIRDSKDPDGLVLTVDPHRWRQWLGQLAAGVLDIERLATIPITGPCFAVRRSGDTILVRDASARIGYTLRFTIGEWQAFLVGAARHEFDLTPAGRFADHERQMTVTSVVPTPRRHSQHIVSA